MNLLCQASSHRNIDISSSSFDIAKQIIGRKQGPAVAATHSGMTDTSPLSLPLSNGAGLTIQLSKYSIAVPSAIASLASMSSSSAMDDTLGPDFEPERFDVVCGRGKGFYNRPGNRHLLKLMAEYIPRYTEARSRIDKSLILNEIVERVQSLINPETERRAQFVRYSPKDGWKVIDIDAARDKVGHAMREAIQARARARSTTSTGPSSSSGAAAKVDK